MSQVEDLMTKEDILKESDSEYFLVEGDKTESKDFNYSFSRGVVNALENVLAF